MLDGRAFPTRLAQSVVIPRVMSSPGVAKYSQIYFLTTLGVFMYLSFCARQHVSQSKTFAGGGGCSTGRNTPAGYSARHGDMKWEGLTR
jgi:hypothetical protein